MTNFNIFDFRGKKKKGFFIEAGALEGEHISNTLYFEVKHQVRYSSTKSKNLKAKK
jgi:hypothetical protein